MAVVFGRPEEAQHFVDRNPVFLRFLPRLRQLLQRAFGRQLTLDKTADGVIFALGRVAVEDFFELLTLCGHGYGIGALKMLRGLYELVVTCGYLTKHPDQAPHFLDFHHVHERKGFNHLTRTGFEPAKALSAEKVREIEAEFQRVKGQFTEPDCEKCGTTRIQMSWTRVDPASMAQELGISATYPAMYFWPTMQIHATTYRIVTRFGERGDTMAFEQGPQRREADAALAGARVLMGVLLEFQDDYFKLGLGKDLLQLNTEYHEALPGTAG